jgi:hypothetical protein
VFSPVLPAKAAPVVPPSPPVTSPSPFTPPATEFSGPGESIQASERVRSPAMGMMIGGILSVLYALLDLMFSVLFLLGLFQMGPPPANLPPFWQQFVQPNPRQVMIGAISDGVRLVWCMVIIYGALKMSRLQSYGLAMTSSILSLIPCLACCCFLSIPFGIWSLVVLSRPEVRANFR